MNVFADSSALVKIYADEERSAETRAALSGMTWVSALASVEVPAALWRKVRAGELNRVEARVLTDTFVADMNGTLSSSSRFIAVAISGRVLGRAAGLVESHGLRGYDAVQLASAIVVREVDANCRVFACYDKGLVAAAAHEGFHTDLAGL